MDHVLLMKAIWEKSTGNAHEAVSSINDLLEKYPLSIKVPAALLVKAQVYERLNLGEQAKGVLTRLAKNYPKSPEGLEAQRKLTPKPSSPSAKRTGDGIRVE